MHSLIRWWHSLGRAEQILVGFIGAAIAVSLFFRIYNLTFPAKQVFDEVYFPVFAKNYITQTAFFDVHPPLGKYAIAAGIWIFGDSYLGWRIIPLLAGIGIIWLMFQMTRRLTGSWLTALFVSLFVALDGMFIVYSRTGLMDGVLYFATMAVFAAALTVKEKWFWLVVGVLLGLAVAIKWPAAAIFIPTLWVAWRRGVLHQLLYAVPLAILVYLSIVLSGEFLIGEANPWTHMWWWHDQAFGYHEHLTDTHPYGSPWWSWPIMKRPVLFLYDSAPGGGVQLITTLANPALLYTSSLAVLGAFVVMVRKFLLDWRLALRHPLVPMLLGYASAWLPWAAVTRVAFLYHYLPAYGFALMIMAYGLSWLWRRERFSVAMFMALIAVAFVVYIPWWVGWLPVTTTPLRGLLYSGWIF